MTASEILTELAALAGRNVGARACLRKFLDQGPVVAALNVDRLATSVAGETIYRDEPTEGLLACLSACRALDRQDHALAAGGAHV